MREIKFRAWDQKKKKLLQHDEMYIDFDGDTYFSAGSYEGIIVFPAHGLVLSQYTGLKDKNGVEIYEGDILTHEGYETGIAMNSLEHEGIIHSETAPFMSCYGIQSIKNKIFYSFMNVYDPTRFMEVIGNIYENPELLNDKY